jgi:hypothetical protein
VIEALVLAFGLIALLVLVTAWVVVVHEVRMRVEAMLRTLVARGLVSEAESIRLSNRVWRI